MIGSLRHFLGWILSAFSSGRTSFSKTWLFVSNCWLGTGNDLAVD
jgi:hypothetical protein